MRDASALCADASMQTGTSKLVAGLVLGLSLVAWTQSAFGQSAPKKYQDLYRELDAQLSAFDRRLPPVSAGKAPIRAATLLSANCQRGEIILGSAQLEGTLRELDALKSLDADGIVLQVCYPLLTPRFRDPQPFLDYYANLANQVRARGMKLLVEHDSLLPAYASVDPRPYYRKLTKQRFERERYEELKTIVLALQPDYLTLVSEPRTHSSGLKLTAKDWRKYIQRSVDTLSQQLGSFPTLLGAGSGLWDDFAYVEAFAGIKGLSYIDLHLYPLATGGQSNLDRLLAWPDRIRAIDPGKRIVMSEAWLYKAGGAEVLNPAADGKKLSPATLNPATLSPATLNLAILNPAVFARDVYSFWVPLDEKFLRVVGVAAREKGIELVAPYGSRYFFAYLDYNDPLTFRLKAKDLMSLASQRAYEAILRGQVTDTGLAFRGM